MKIKYFIPLLFILNIQSQELSIVKINNSFESTSDQYLIRSTVLDYNKKRRDLFWNYEGELEDSWDYGARVTKNTGQFNSDFSGTKAELLLGRKFSLKESISPLI